MHKIKSREKKERKPFWAVLLSLGATGLGHIYCGKLSKGITLFFISFAFAPIIVSSVDGTLSHFSIAAIVGSILILLSVFFYALIDAYFLAKKVGYEYHLKEYNRWYIYLLFIIVSISYPSNFSNYIKDHVIQAFKIPSTSMAPSILRGDFIFLNKTIYKKSTPKPGDIVIFVHPNHRYRNYIKRVIALPGEHIEIKDNMILINDKSFTYKPVDQKKLAAISGQVTGEVLEEVIRPGNKHKIMISSKKNKSYLSDFKRFKVPNGHCFVLGDNRMNSQDSREFGPIPLSDIKGRVDYIYFPAETWERFGRYKDG